MTPWLQDPDVTLYHGDCLDVLRTLPDKSVHMCATSPPFYGLRDYGTGEWEGGDTDCDHKAPSRFDYATSDKQLSNAGSEQHSTFRDACGKCGARRVDKQIGLEETPDQWVENLVRVFREVRRVLRDDGTLWVEIGDSYGAKNGRTDADRMGASLGSDDPVTTANSKYAGDELRTITPHHNTGTKPKDLLGQPWLLAFALRADGWYLRSEIIWARPNPMPESVTDRPTKSHSTVFLLSKQPRYFYDADAIRTAPDPQYAQRRFTSSTARDGHHGVRPAIRSETEVTSVHSNPAGANARTVWTIPTQPTPFAHFATWPEALVRRMILAGTSEKGCCPQCGDPWIRNTEREVLPLQDTNNSQPETPRGWDADRTHPRARLQIETVGWSPSCACDGITHRLAQPDEGYIVADKPLPPVPCTVLDPFAGSATTNLVARNHGRHSIGIELNETYLQIAGRRLQQLSLLA